MAFRNYQDMYKNRVKKILKFPLFCLVNGKIQSGRIQNNNLSALFLYTYPGKVHILRKKKNEGKNNDNYKILLMSPDARASVRS